MKLVRSRNQLDYGIGILSPSSLSVVPSQLYGGFLMGDLYRPCHHEMSEMVNDACKMRTA